jgi:hypothetical protein
VKIYPTYFLLLFALFAGFCSQAQAQQDYSAELFVIGSAGGSDTAVTTSGQFISVQWTIGEVLVGDRKGSKKWLTQGFHQDFWESYEKLKNLKSTYIFSILDQENTRHFSIFPNPFVTNFSVQWNFSENLNLLFEVFTLDGKRVFSQRQNAMSSQLHIQLNNLRPSTYILRISDPSRNFYESHKIVKF